MAEKNQFVEHLLDLLAGLGPVHARAMFGGYGIYKGECMFALVIDDTLFFKADERTKPEFDALGLPPFSYERGNRTISLAYYQAPDETLEDPVAMHKWAGKAYAAALRRARKSRRR
jgi:DNA transformation protein and related proteins